MKDIAKLLSEARKLTHGFLNNPTNVSPNIGWLVDLDSRLESAAAEVESAEPVAWTSRNQLNYINGGDDGRMFPEGDDAYVDIPLYRHPPSAVPEWIPVWERMPEELKYTHALITLDNGDNQWVVADRYDGYSKSWENHYDPSGTVCVTHWMPLPAAPQGGDV